MFDDLDKDFLDLNDDLEALWGDKDYALFVVFFLFDNIELYEPYELLFLWNLLTTALRSELEIELLFLISYLTFWFELEKESDLLW